MKSLGMKRLATACALGALLGVVGCAEQDASAPEASGETVQLANGDVCVDIPEGYYSYASEPDQFTPVTFVEGATYRVQDGALVLVSGPTRGPALSGSALASRISGDFPALGFDWLGLNVTGSIATLTGTAPSRAEAAAAYEAGRNAVLNHPDAGGISLVVDGIAVEGGDAGVGAALVGLGDNPDIGTCQAAFIETMEGRNIEFQTDSFDIDPVSARLLDALTGVAILCTQSGNVQVEIGGHTDVRGSATTNARLSQERADAVREYLIRQGVNANALIAIGYGESAPLDTAVSEAAHRRNRRTEFTLRPR